MRMRYRETGDLAVLALRPPIALQIGLAVRRTGVPELVGILIAPFFERRQKRLGGAFLGPVLELVVEDRRQHDEHGDGDPNLLLPALPLLIDWFDIIEHIWFASFPRAARAPDR